MPDIHFDRYYRYDDLTQLLHAFAAEHPTLIQIESIGQSYEGRAIWLATMTNTATGPASEKPALWIDGNIHASEVSPSSACLYFIHWLVNGYGHDSAITQVLDSRVFYICPRVNPDGAEWALADRPKIVRSSTRPYPYDEEPIDGLAQEDVDGDGRMLSMRVPDANGGWKVSPDEPRLMVRRDPDESGGQYYRLLPEGRIDNYDGVLIKLQRKKEGLDLNRNFPMEWRTEGEQPGAGPFPASEPEVRAMVHFIAAHPNITGGIAFHTYSGVLLRPFSTHPDEICRPKTCGPFRRSASGARSSPAIRPSRSIMSSATIPRRSSPARWTTGCTTIWGSMPGRWRSGAPQRQAGIEGYKYIDWFRQHPFEDDRKLLAWSDEKLGGQGYVDWYPFQHPQLGPVELGGWNAALAFRNPPPSFLEQELALFPRWLLWHLAISPRLELLEASAAPLGDGAHRVRLVVQNSGWLPSYITKKAVQRKAVRGVVAEIELSDGATLAAGQPREELGPVGGPRLSARCVAGLGAETTDDRLKVEWVVVAPAGGQVKLLARHPRAGVVRAQLTL
jgi:murein tripeptide amidase MpaA